MITDENITTEYMVTDGNVMNEPDTTINDNENLNLNQPPLSSLLCEKRDKPYFLPHKFEKSQFYVCVKGQLFLLNCPSGYRFDNNVDQCVRKTIEDEIKESMLFIISMIIFIYK
jgi:hypothetical protein